MKKHKNDRGYSLVEMIIVIAIIAIVATLAIVSITLIHSARAKEAAVTVDEEIATLITKSKNMKCEKGSDWQYAARIYYHVDDQKYYFQKGYYNTSTKQYDFTTGDTESDGKGKSLTGYVDVKFNGTREILSDDLKTTGSQVIAANNAMEIKSVVWGVPIRFNKDGSCATGYGNYSFLKKNGNEVANDYIRQNGSHQSR
ncbi:MAG: prepilin-type N-terminal cleavage/methylation domain-containing protein [Eubacterium sp.]|nr:prepilin-type N-terminal cleavage/methylation domain-containing protein [Eubacterium sp.]